MTYQEAKWIVNEVERLIECFESNSMSGIDSYKKVIPDNVYPSTLNKMSIDEVNKIIKSYYGAYNEYDIVTDEMGVPCMITYIDYRDAETIHEIRYHVIYAGGMTNIISIDDIKSKLGSYSDAMKLCDMVLNEYFDKEIEKMSNNSK